MNYLRLVLSLLGLGLFLWAQTVNKGRYLPLGKFLNPTAGIWQNEKDESITGSGCYSRLQEKVSVHYDAQMIPHVFAQNEHDLYKAQGYLTAKHRLWQMEFQTHAAAGRLSEIIGEGALNYDRTERRRGMGYGAEQSLAYMENTIQKYWHLFKTMPMGSTPISTNCSQKITPWNTSSLDYAPEAWTTKKTALLLMYMTKMLAGRDKDLEYTNVLRLIGEENFNLLFPDFFEVTDPVIPKETDWSFIDVPQTEQPKKTVILDTIAETIEKPHPDNGSNNWAVAGSKSTSGYPILANDPHLGLNLPSIWFVMQLSSPQHNAFGATIPGALAVISGFNEHIAWGETNATRDVIDWYKVEFNEDRTQYKYNGVGKMYSNALRKSTSKEKQPIKTRYFIPITGRWCTTKILRPKMNAQVMPCAGLDMREEVIKKPSSNSTRPKTTMIMPTPYNIG